MHCARGTGLLTAFERLETLTDESSSVDPIKQAKRGEA